jgi:hypothetical protein
LKAAQGRRDDAPVELMTLCVVCDGALAADAQMATSNVLVLALIEAPLRSVTVTLKVALVNGAL